MQVRYLQSYHVARALQVSPRCLSYLTGNVFVSCEGKRYNLGLRIKDANNKMCVPDYAKPQDEQRGWTYSELTTQVLQQYRVTCPPPPPPPGLWGLLLQHSLSTGDACVGFLIMTEKDAAVGKYFGIIIFVLFLVIVDWE